MYLCFFLLSILFDRPLHHSKFTRGWKIPDTSQGEGIAKAAKPRVALLVKVWEARNWILRKCDNYRDVWVTHVFVLFLYFFQGMPNVGICTKLFQQLVPTTRHADVFFVLAIWQFLYSVDLSDKKTPKGAVGFAGKILLFWMPYSTDLGNDSLFLMSWGRRRSCALDEKEGKMWSKWRQLKQFELGIELLSWSINFNQLFMSIITVIIPLRIYKRIKKHHGWSRRIPYWQVPGFIYLPSRFLRCKIRRSLHPPKKHIVSWIATYDSLTHQQT